MSKEAKQERLEKMIRDELEENNSARQTPVQSLLTQNTPGAPNSVYNQSSTSLRRGPGEDERSRPFSGMEGNQY
jgi:hypothetical protein